MNESLGRSLSTVSGSHSATYGVEGIAIPTRYPGFDGIEPACYRSKLIGHRPLREVVQGSGRSVGADGHSQVM